MRRFSVWIVIGLLSATAAMAEKTPGPKQTPQIHNSACALADSMAGKLGSTKVTPETAQRSCQALAPTMNATDHAEFMRCCISRLVTGAPPKPAAPKQHLPADGAQQM